MYRALIVDDEEDARSVMRKMLELFCPDIGEVYEAESTLEAMRQVRRRHFHVAFLDIRLGQENGLQLATKLSGHCDHIIFVTAFDAYAVQAFQIGAVHYLVKPVSPDLLQDAVSRIVTPQEPLVQEERIYLRSKEEITVLEQREILFLRGDGNYVTFHTRDGQEVFVSRNISYYLRQLNADRFVRTHQSYVINKQDIASLSNDGLKLTLTTGQEIPVSRRNRDQVRQLFS